MALSALGIFHTAVGVVTLGAGIVSFIQSGKIDPGRSAGKLYFYGTAITSLTALGISRHGGFNPGHIFSLFIVALIAVAYFLHFKRQGRTRARYWENFLFSLSFFLSWIPTINETLTRLPSGHPVAKDVADPLIGRILFSLLLLFLAGSVIQFRQQRRLNKQ